MVLVVFLFFSREDIWNNIGRVQPLGHAWGASMQVLTTHVAMQSALQSYLLAGRTKNLTVVLRGDPGSNCLDIYLIRGHQVDIITDASTAEGISFAAGFVNATLEQNSSLVQVQRGAAIAKEHVRGLTAEERKQIQEDFDLRVRRMFP
jgi:hypothetical protein